MSNEKKILYSKIIHIQATSQQSPPELRHLLHWQVCFLRFEVFAVVTMKNGVFWDVTPCGSCKNRHFGGTWRLLHEGDKNR
jgi:hypothetical protein